MTPDDRPGCDGLAADLLHVCRASGVAARFEPTRLPLPRGFAAACARAGVDPLRLALAVGEDYELLFSMRRGAPSAAGLARRLGVPVTEIGRLEPGRPAVRGLPRSTGGWRYF